MNDAVLGEGAGLSGPRRRWPLAAIGLLGVIWIVALMLSGPVAGSALTEIAQQALPFFAPVLVLLLMLVLLPLGRRPLEIDELEQRVMVASQSTQGLEEQLGRVNRLLADSLANVESMRAAAAPHGDGLAATAIALEVAAGTMAMATTDMTTAAGHLLEHVPALTEQAERAEAALKIAGSEARRHVEAVDAALSQVASHGRDAGREAVSTITAMQALITQIDQSSGETTKAIAGRAYTLDAAVTGVLERSAEAFGNIGDTLTAQAHSVEQMVTNARSELQAVSSDGTRAIGQRIDVLLGAAGQLRQQFIDQQQLADQFHLSAAQGIETVEARLAQLQQRQEAAALGLLAETNENAGQFEERLSALSVLQDQAGLEMKERMSRQITDLEQHLQQLNQRQQDVSGTLHEAMSRALVEVEERLEALRESTAIKQQETSELISATAAQVDDLGGRIGERHQTLHDLQQQIEALGPLFENIAADADSRIPALAQGLDGVAQRGRSVIGELDELAERIDSQVAILRDTSAAFERDHQSVVNLSQNLAGEFETARAAVNEINHATEQTAMAAAARMVENVMQVRQAVNSTANEVKELLGSVVNEAQAALDDFATTKAEAAFGAPIRLQIAALEDASVKAAEAAGGASEKLTSRLLDLLRVIAETETRVDEVDTRMDVRARDTLAARSLRLVESLNEASVDVARLLAIDVGDSAWARYLSGDKSIFARATVRLSDKETNRKIARHFAHDPEFEGEAARYLEQFETLIRRVLKDPDGEAFALVLLSSDIGKLYVMIAEAIGRPLPRRED